MLRQAQDSTVPTAREDPDTASEPPTAQGEQRGGSAAGRARAILRHRRHALGVGLIATVSAVVYAAYLLVMNASLQDGLPDVGEFDQAVSGYAHFMGPHSPFVGLPNLANAGVSQLSDHFTPLLALLAPGYWIYDGPQTLLIETAILAVLPMIPLWIFTRRALNVPAAYLVIVGYALSWPLQEALWFEFHEVFFAMPIMAWMLERAQARKRLQAALVSLLLLGVKDDMGFVVAVFGVYLACKDLTLRQWLGFLRRPLESVRGLLGRRPRWLPLVLIPVGLIMVSLVGSVLIPHFGGSPNRDFSYGEFGATQSQALHTMIEHPLRVLHVLIDKHVKRHTLLLLLLPTAFLALFSPIALLTVPLLLERFLSTNSLYWAMPLHYNAFVVVILLCAGVDGAARVAGWIPRLERARRLPRLRPALATAFAAYVAVFAIVTAHQYPLAVMDRASFWRSPSKPVVTAAMAAVAHVPPNVVVAAASQVGPQLLHKDKVIMWSFPGDRGYPATPWVLANVDRISWPFPNMAVQQADVNAMLADGYHVVFQDDGWLVLENPHIAA